MLFCAQNQKSSQKIAIFFYPRAHNIASEGIFRDNERWLSRARAFPSCFSGWNHSANAAPGITIRLNMLAAPLFKHSIRLDILANTSSDHSIRLETRATPLFKHPIQLDMPIPSPPKHPPPIGNAGNPSFQTSHPIGYADTLSAQTSPTDWHAGNG